MKMLSRIGLGALLLLAAGCCGYETDWEEAAKAPPPADSPEGRWKGAWRSDVNGHEGGLRCIISKRPDGRYDAHYHATFAWCIFTLSGDYTVPFDVARDGKGWKLHGESDLGWLYGGVYTYEAHIEDDDFTSTYKSEDDAGVFQLDRVKP